MYLVDYLSTQNFYQPKNELLTYENAAYIYFSCRKKGLIVRSSIDCLIAEICLEYDLILLANDNDYKKIQTVFPELKLAF